MAQNTNIRKKKISFINHLSTHTKDQNIKGKQNNPWVE